MNLQKVVKHEIPGKQADGRKLRLIAVDSKYLLHFA